MSEFFDGIKQGLLEAIEYEKGNLPNVKVHRVVKQPLITIAPLNIYSSNGIRALRVRQNMTQKSFAEAMGVSVKTVEAWESGTNSPSGVATRMLALLKQDDGLFEKYSIVTRQ